MGHLFRVAHHVPILPRMTFSTAWLRLTVSAALIAVAAGCGGALKYQLQGSDLSPGADADLVADVDIQRNVTNIGLAVNHLTPAERVLEGGTAYVVWARRDDQVPWVRLGALELSDEGRKGAAKLTISETSFDLEVTAEQNATVASPSGKTVLSQRIQGGGD